jgi:hypothetical protein
MFPKQNHPLIQPSANHNFLIMNIFNDLFLLQRLDHLIRTRATGNPIRLAGRLDVCERTVYRLINKLRDAGLPIAYDKETETYYYEQPVQIRIDIQVNGDCLLRINGGAKLNLTSTKPLTFFVGEEAEFCEAFLPMRAGRGAGGC